VSTEEYMNMNPNQAKRPLNSRMSKRSLIEAGFRLLPSWQEAVSSYFSSMNKDETP
jgi:dTDP-4-dehydrorhamnose reductase